MDCSPPGSSVHRDSLGKSTRGGCYALLQGIFPIQELNPGFPQYGWIPHHLSHQGSPEMSMHAAKSPLCSNTQDLHSKVPFLHLISSLSFLGITQSSFTQHLCVRSYSSSRPGSLFLPIYTFSLSYYIHSHDFR